jgi:hypothetical protein
MKKEQQTSVNNLYNEQQNDLQQELQKLYNQNKVVINYFSKIDSGIKEAISSSNKDEVKIMLESVKSQLSNLSNLKFLIFDLEDEIPEELSKKWNKRVKYITQQMSINEVDRFIKVIEEFEDKIEETEKTTNEDRKVVEALYLSVVDANWENLQPFKGILKQIQLAKSSNNMIFEKEILSTLQSFIKYDRYDIFLFLQQIKKLFKVIEHKKEGDLIMNSDIIFSSINDLKNILKDYVQAIENASLNDFVTDKIQHSMIRHKNDIYLNQYNYDLASTLYNEEIKDQDSISNHFK